jgi:hypothetical protein
MAAEGRRTYEQHLWAKHRGGRVEDDRHAAVERDGELAVV